MYVCVLRACASFYISIITAAVVLLVATLTHINKHAPNLCFFIFYYYIFTSMYTT